jgi:hypothetical protein
MTFFNWGSKIDVSIDTISENNANIKYKKLDDEELGLDDKSEDAFYKFYNAKYSLQAYLRPTSRMLTDVIIILCLLVAYVVSETFDFHIVYKEVE